jgi:hypothetical protein
VVYRFKCKTCNEWHEGLPTLGYPEPDLATGVPLAERAQRLFLNSDFCVIDDAHFFVRCVLRLPIIGTDSEFGWGIWSSLSEPNFMRYQDFVGEDRSTLGTMFGYMCNRLPHYPDTINLKLSLQPRNRELRPIATLEPTDHPLAVEQREGIALEKVLEFVGPWLHP